MEDVDSKNQVVININKKLEIKEGGVYLIVAIASFSLIFIVLLVFGAIYLFEPAVLLSPNEGIGSYIADFNFENVVAGDDASLEEINDINKFLENFEFEKSIVREFESIGANEIVIGLSSGFSGFPYLDLLGSEDSVVISDLEADNLYVYSKDLESLKEILNILSSDSENLGFYAIKVDDGIIEELKIN